MQLSCLDGILDGLQQSYLRTQKNKQAVQPETVTTTKPAVSFLFIFSAISCPRARDSMKPETWVCTLGVITKRFWGSPLSDLSREEESASPYRTESGEIIPLFLFFEWFFILPEWERKYCTFKFLQKQIGERNQNPIKWLSTRGRKTRWRDRRGVNCSF